MIAWYARCLRTQAIPHLESLQGAAAWNVQGWQRRRAVTVLQWNLLEQSAEIIVGARTDIVNAGNFEPEKALLETRFRMAITLVSDYKCTFFFIKTSALIGPVTFAPTI